MEKNKKMEIYKNLILDVPGVKTAKFEKSIESSVTTSWGVNWDADFIARDILQNFRDSNLSEIEKVVVNTKNDRILVEGNNCFDLRKLFFVGSNKAGDETTVGEYGEGFKAAVVSMLKRGIQAPVSVSADTAVVIDVGEEVVEDLIVAAIKDAQDKASEKAKEEMGKLSEGLGLPPGMKLPF